MAITRHRTPGTTAAAVAARARTATPGARARSDSSVRRAGLSGNTVGPRLRTRSERTMRPSWGPSEGTGAEASANRAATRTSQPTGRTIQVLGLRVVGRSCSATWTVQTAGATNAV